MCIKLFTLTNKSEKKGPPLKIYVSMADRKKFFDYMSRFYDLDRNDSLMIESQMEILYNIRFIDKLLKRREDGEEENK